MNWRPSGYEPDELPDCSTPRTDDNEIARLRQINQGLGITGVLPAGAMNSRGEGRGGQRREGKHSAVAWLLGLGWRGLHQVLYCVFSKGEMVDEPEWTLVMPVPD